MLCEHAQPPRCPGVCQATDRPMVEAVDRRTPRIAIQRFSDLMLDSSALDLDEELGCATDQGQYFGQSGNLVRTRFRADVRQAKACQLPSIGELGIMVHHDGTVASGVDVELDA